MHSSLRFLAIRLVLGIDLFLFLLLLFLPSPASACSLAIPLHTLDPAEQGVDKMAPEAPVIESVEIARGDGGGCAVGCGDIGFVGLTVRVPKDDRSPPDRLGYVFRFGPNSPVSAPAGGAIRATNGQLALAWLDGATRMQEALDFTITIAAVDLGGNQGPFSAPFRVMDPGRGCRVGGGPHLDAMWIVMPAIALWSAWRRRRHR